MGVLSPESCEFPKELIVVKDDSFFFGQIISNDDTIMSTLRNKTWLFHWSYVQSTKMGNLLL
jgi:hypothetical protein